MTRLAYAIEDDMKVAHLPCCQGIGDFGKVKWFPLGSMCIRSQRRSLKGGGYDGRGGGLSSARCHGAQDALTLTAPRLLPLVFFSRHDQSLQLGML